MPKSKRPESDYPPMSTYTPTVPLRRRGENFQITGRK